jgi:high-affinity Fe2+/Pb2+ permease
VELDKTLSDGQQCLGAGLPAADSIVFNSAAIAFREGGETVLFLKSVVLEAGTKTVIQGTLLGLAGVAVVGTAVFVMQRKLPHKKMLMVTGVMIALVLVTMVGNTIHVFQIVGWAPITPLGTFQFPTWMSVWFGLFATWEGIVAQLAALIFAIGSYFAAEWSKNRSQRHMMAEDFPGLKSRAKTALCGAEHEDSSSVGRIHQSA